MNKAKRWLAMLCVAALCVTPVSAAGIGDWETGESYEDIVMTDAAVWEEMTAGDTLDVKAKSAILISLSDGAVLYEQDADKPLPIASVTKVMTLLLVMEAIDNRLLGVEDTLTCSPEAAALGGSQIWLEPGETMTVHDLLKAVAVVSANDASAMLAEAVSGSQESFVQAMNKRAGELGLKNTRFLDCCGLNDEAYSSARDVAIISRELMSHSGITDYTTIWMDSLRGGESALVNTNKLVRFYKGATGLKTGTTAAAGHCLAATAEREGMGLCAVVLGCASTADRFAGARRLLDYGFANYALFTPCPEELVLNPVTVLYGEAPSFQPVTAQGKPLLLRRGQEQQIETLVEQVADVEAPVLADQIVGKVTYRLEGQVLATYPIRAKKPVGRLSWWQAVTLLWRELSGRAIS